MAVITSSSSAGLVKAVVLPLVLVVLVVAAGASGTEAGAAVAKSGGRFSETPGGRKLLDYSKACGTGSAPFYNCTSILPGTKNPICCTYPNGNQSCVEVGDRDVTNCGSCFNKCIAGQLCCSGVCVDQMTDKNHCGICENSCPGAVKCKSGLCGY